MCRQYTHGNIRALRRGRESLGAMCLNAWHWKSAPLLTPLNLTSPKSNNPNYPEGSSVAHISYQNHRGPSRTCPAPNALEAPPARSTLLPSVRTPHWPGPHTPTASRRWWQHSSPATPLAVAPFSDLPRASSGLSSSPRGAIGGGRLIPWPPPLPPSPASSSPLILLVLGLTSIPWLQITQGSQRLPRF